tara:strand:- start:592 stop:1299 length:708 start_codon:yes stop_codon:yes gene_type:complete
MANNTERRRKAAERRRLTANEKKYIDSIIKGEDTDDKKLGPLSKNPFFQASVKKAKREVEVREDRKKKELPPETIFEKSTRQRKESDAAKAKANLKKQKPTKKPDKTAAQIAAEANVKKPIGKAANRVSKQKPTPKKEGSEYKAYPGAAGRAGFEYRRDTAEILDDKNISDEIKERIEEAELYEGDFKGGRVGKGKKKKVSKAPRGVRAAMRGFKTMKTGGKVGKRTKGTGGGWV